MPNRWIFSTNLATQFIYSYGRISSLLTYSFVSSSTATYPPDCTEYTDNKTFVGLFANSTNLFSAPRIDLRGRDYAFARMFQSAVGLREAPLIGWNLDIGTGGMLAMFQGCTNLESVPFLSRSDDSNSSLNNLFCNCTSLKVKSGSASGDCVNYFWNSQRNYSEVFKDINSSSPNKGDAGISKYYTNLRVIKRPEWNV